MNDELQATLVTMLKTRQEADLFMQCIQDTIDQTYDVKQTLAQKLKKAFPANLYLILMDLFSDLHTDMGSAQAITGTMKTILQAAKKLQSITLTIALPPTDVLLTYICNVAQDVLNQSMLLDVTYDPTIYAGAVISHNGTYKDYSLRKAVQALQTK